MRRVSLSLSRIVNKNFCFIVSIVSSITKLYFENITVISYVEIFSNSSSSNIFLNISSRGCFSNLSCISSGVLLLNVEPINTIYC